MPAARRQVPSLRQARGVEGTFFVRLETDSATDDLTRGGYFA